MVTVSNGAGEEMEMRWGKYYDNNNNNESDGDDGLCAYLCKCSLTSSFKFMPLKIKWNKFK